MSSSDLCITSDATRIREKTPRRPQIFTFICNFLTLYSAGLLRYGPSNWVYTVVAIWWVAPLAGRCSPIRHLTRVPNTKRKTDATCRLIRLVAAAAFA